MQRTNFSFYVMLFVAFLFLKNNLYAQTITKSYQFPPFEIMEFEVNDQQVKRLIFEGSITTFDYPALPALRNKIEVNHLYTSYNYTLSNAKYQPLTPEETALIPKEYVPTEPVVYLKTAVDKKNYAMLTIIPIVKNSAGQYQRLVSCDIRFEGTEPMSLAKKSGAKNSVLTSGTWYKIAVGSTGLHKVTYSDLQKLSVPVSGLRSTSIALFGNGGGMLPDINPVEQIDDLLECPIMIVDNGSGAFNESSYFVFYAQGPHSWDYNATSDKFTHKYNIYSDSAYYFINVDTGIGEKKRIVPKSFLNQTENKTITTFTHYDFYEKDVNIFGESGREWFDSPLYASSTQTYNFVLPELKDNTARLKISAASTSSSSSSMEISWSGNTKSFSFSGTSALATRSTFDQNVSFPSSNVALTLKYNATQSSALAYLDYIEIQAKCNLKINSGAMPFAITENIGAGNFALVQVGNASNQTKIWDVTDHNAVYELTGTSSGNQFSFKTPTDKPRTFIAFNGTDYKSVSPVGKVANQNLHGFGNVEMVIVSHPNFLSEANRLAQFRAKQNGITVKVVTPQQVYNEFSSGAQDIGAIRNFMRYLYENHSQSIQYLLLFGRPSYDYRGKIAGIQLFVPNYQGINSDNSISEDSAFACDDFFGILDYNEGSLNSDLIDVAVGRFPVSTLEEAKIAVDKTINASVRNKITAQNASQVSNFGDWRNVMTFVADDKYKGFLNDGYFLGEAEKSANEIASNTPAFNLEKIYCDAYPQVSYAGGYRYPDANNAIKMRMERGTLTIAYFGHGGGNGWAHARILEKSDIDKWKNKYNQPFMITITCSFGWYDKQSISPAEIAFLSDNGGVCAMITTSRISYSNPKYGRQLFHEIRTKWNESRYKTVGEIHKLGKNNVGGTAQNTNMVYLIGDPAMLINIPNQKITTDTIACEDLPVIDSVKALSYKKPWEEINMRKIPILKALSKVTIKGRVTDDSGNTLTHFNGNVYPSVFDKAVKQKPLNQEEGEPKDFLVQKNAIFKGNATVTNGQFEFSFFVPKDINYEYGRGKISYYAASENDDAADYYDNFLIGGMSDNPITDKEGPEINIYLNDEKFVPGGITNPNPVLLLKLKDEYGINTTGNGIGHDLVAILDNNIEKQMVLNDYYLADQDSYNSGTVRYPLQNLESGTHILKARAWDIFNNPTENTIEFVVKSDEKLELAHVLNYPNPFTTNTEFRFEINQPTDTYDILIHIFTISGKLVKTIQDTRFIEGTVGDKLFWDGRDEFGDKIGKGVYIYRLTVRNSQGDTAEKIEKIAIL
jgi:hypothetical protein